MSIQVAIEAKDAKDLKQKLCDLCCEFGMQATPFASPKEGIPGSGGGEAVGSTSSAAAGKPAAARGGKKAPAKKDEAPSDPVVDDFEAPIDENTPPAADTAEDLFDEAPAASAKPVTQDDVKKALQVLSEKKGMDTARNVVKGFGVSRIGELKAEQFAPFVSACDKAGK